MDRRCFLGALSAVVVAPFMPTSTMAEAVIVTGDGWKTYSQPPLRVGDTITVRLPARFRVKMK